MNENFKNCDMHLKAVRIGNKNIPVIVKLSEALRLTDKDINAKQRFYNKKQYLIMKNQESATINGMIKYV